MLRILKTQMNKTKMKSFFYFLVIPLYIFSCGDRASIPAPTTNTNGLGDGGGNVDFVYTAGADSVLYYRKQVPINVATAVATSTSGNSSSSKVNTPPILNTTVLKCFFEGKTIDAADAVYFDPFANDKISGYKRDRLLIEDLETASKLSVVFFNGVQQFKLPASCDAGVTSAQFSAGANQTFLYNIYYLEDNGSKTLLDNSSISLRYQNAP